MSDVILFRNLSARGGDPVPAVHDPRRATLASCGLDLSMPEDVVIPPLRTVSVRHFLSFHLPPGYFGQVLLRRSSAFLDISIKAGCIDSDFRGELSIAVKNERADEAVTLHKHSSYWQLVVQPCFTGIVGKEFKVETAATVHRPPPPFPAKIIDEENPDNDVSSSGAFADNNDEEEDALLLEFLRKEEEEEADRAAALQAEQREQQQLRLLDEIVTYMD